MPAMKTQASKSGKILSVHSAKTRDFNKLTPKQHIVRELELWGVITSLQIKLREARKRIRNLKKEAH